MKRILKLFLLTFVMLFLSCIFFSCKLTNINAAENAILVNNSSVDIKIQIDQTTYDISANSTSSASMSWTDSILITNKER
ncbi:MAG: hypothetical protein IJR49_00710, partial [Treponema sp.]|nr:hypothetical protein [Treponema sp.]